jgi:serine/threonine protein kinase
MIPIFNILSTSLKILDNKRGAFGQCYEGYIKDITSERLIFKKYLNINSDKITGDVVNEILLLKYLKDCENVVTMYGLAKTVDTNELFIVLEYLDCSIMEIVPEKFKLDQFKNIFLKIVKAYYELHKMGVFHSDVKLNNIMLKNNIVKLIDFGGSVFLGMGTSTGYIKHVHITSSTLPPDSNKTCLYKKHNRKSYCSDVYSIGVIMCHIITLTNSKFFIRGKKICGSKLKQDIILSETEYSELSNVLVTKKTNIDGKLSVSYYDFNDYKDYSKEIYKKIGNEGYDLLLKMLDNDCLKRIALVDVINSSFFGGNNTLTKYYNLEIEKYLNKFIELTYKNELISYIKTIKYKVNNKIFKNNEYLYEKSLNLEYFDSIIHTQLIIRINNINDTKKIDNIFSYYNSLFGVNKNINSNDFLNEVQCLINPISIHGCIIALIISLKSSLPINLNDKLCYNLLELAKTNTFYMISLETNEINLWNIIQYSLLISLKICNHMYGTQFDKFITTNLSNNIINDFDLSIDEYNKYLQNINLDRIFEKI